MDGWMDQLIYGCMMLGWMDGCMNGWMDLRMDDVRMDRRMNGCLYGSKDG